MQALLLTGIKSARWDAIEFYDIHAAIGELTFQQLADLRHRGAFSAVSQTFTTWVSDLIAPVAALSEDRLQCTLRNSLESYTRGAGSDRVASLTMFSVNLVRSHRIWRSKRA